MTEPRLEQNSSTAFASVIPSPMGVAEPELPKTAILINRHRRRSGDNSRCFESTPLLRRNSFPLTRSSERCRTLQSSFSQTAPSRPSGVGSSPGGLAKRRWAAGCRAHGGRVLTADQFRRRRSRLRAQALDVVVCSAVTAWEVAAHPCWLAPASATCVIVRRPAKARPGARPRLAGSRHVSPPEYDPIRINAGAGAARAKRAVPPMTMIG